MSNMFSTAIGSSLHLRRHSRLLLTLLLLGMALSLMLDSSRNVRADVLLVNGSFETGDLSGWVSAVPPGGFSAAVVNDFGLDDDGFPEPMMTPVDGNFYALLKTNGPGSLATLTQVFHAHEGDAMHGCAFFNAEDYMPFNDNAQVYMIDPAGVSYVLWDSSVAATGDHGLDPWRLFGFKFATTGDYTLQARIGNALDSVLDSYMGIDNVKAGPPPALNGGNEPPCPSGPGAVDPGQIHGTKFNDLNENGQQDPGEPGVPGVQICVIPFGGCTITDPNGDYSFAPVAPGMNVVTEFLPPGSVNTTPINQVVFVPPGGIIVDVDFGNTTPTPPPGEVDIGGDSGWTYNGLPVIYWGSSTTYTKNVTLHCGANSPVQVKLRILMPETGGSFEGMMTNLGGETWSITFPPFFPHHGTASLTFYVDCPPDTVGFPEALPDADGNGLPDNMSGEDEIQDGGNIYIDPSGTVTNACTGALIAGATVTLLMQTAPGVFGIPDPSLTIPDTNPQITDATGAYGWTVVAGTWKVTAAAAGYLPGESFALAIPPAVTDLVIALDPVGGCAPPPDNDGDGIPDALDPDDDNDGFSDAVEIAAGTDPFDAASVPENCKGVVATIVGTAGNNTINGTEGPDVIVGKGGNDTIRGLGGDDILCGDEGNDTLTGGLGMDKLFGGLGDDSLYGREDADVLWGEDGNDRLFGEGGNDELHGGNGIDKVDGGDGDDVLFGDAGDDEVIGGLGNDTMQGNDGNDRMFGRAGNDTMYGNDGNDTLYGEEGDDILTGDAGNDNLKCGAGVDTADGGAGIDAAGVDCEAVVGVP